MSVIGTLSGLVLFLAFPAVQCICFLEGTPIGKQKDKFVFAFTENPAPEPGKKHGSAACEADCTPFAASCKVNGTLKIKNNSGGTVTPRWQGDMGGTALPAGQEADFVTGCVLISCGNSKRIELAAEGQGVVASYNWVCNPCGKP